MKSYKPIKEVIRGKQLASRKVLENNMHFEDCDRTLITGRVKNSHGEYIKNAAVEIMVVKGRCRLGESLGVVFTDTNGSYAVSVDSCKCYYYILNIYTPLSSI